MSRAAVAQVPDAPPVESFLPRLTAMDGLRGLAAFSVFIWHAWAAFPGRQPNLLDWLVDGDAAVDLFFVLSGFVLALPYTGKRSDQRLSYPAFLIRRVFRLYPAYLASISLALAAKQFMTSSVFGYGIVKPGAVSHSQILRAVLMVAPGIPVDRIEPVIWSLILEMRVSIVFPFFIYAMRRLRPQMQWFAWGGAAVIGCFVPLITYPAFFLLGIAIASNLESLKSLAAGLPAAVKAACWVSALWLFHGAHVLTEVRLQRDTVVSVAVALLIVLTCATPAASRVLSTAPMRFLGDVSYSFYLVHQPLLFLFISLFLPYGIWLCMAGGLLLSWLVAWLMFHYLEMPLHQFGRRISKRFA